MMQAALRPTPRLRDVLREHVRVLWLALRLPAAVAAVPLALAVLVVVHDYRRQGAIDFHPERFLLPALLGLALPLLVWRRADQFGAGFLWTLPVDRRRHALTRVLAGWLWLMAAVALFVLWLLALTLLSGGTVLGAETIRVLAAGVPVPAPGALVGADALRTVRLAPQPLLWLTPFTAATGAYLFASAVALGLRHPLRWLVGTALGLQFVAIAGDAADVEWVMRLPGRLLDLLYAGTLGLDTLLSAGTESAEVRVTLATGEFVLGWRAVPHPGHWAAGTLLWLAVGLVLLWAAASRHRELRRA